MSAAQDGAAGRPRGVRDARTVAAAVLLLAAIVTSVAGSALLAPLRAAGPPGGPGTTAGPAVLDVVAASPDAVAAGALLQVLAGLTSAGIAVAFYPVIRRRAEALALGSVVLRCIEGTLYVVAALGALLLVDLSSLAAGSGTSTAAGLLLALRDRASTVGIVAFYLGAALYYAAFVRCGLVPRWLSLWGLGAAGLGLVAALLTFFGGTTTFSPVQLALNLPILLNELVLAAWLLARGWVVREA